MKLLLIMAIFSFKMLFTPVEIKWSDDFQLTKEHFVQKEILIDNQLANICTGVNLDINYHGVNKFRAYSFINTKLSSIRADLTGDKLERVLEHEKGHFAITEIVTRQLNRKLADVNSERQARFIYQEYLRILDNSQKEYDRDTDHYNNQEEQKNYRRIIPNFLKDLDNYKY